MSREMKVRGFIKPTIENGEVIYEGGMLDSIHSIDFANKCVKYVEPIWQVGGSIGTYEYVDFDDIVLMWWTGLVDKNGRDVYDGDILHVLEVSNTNTLEYDSPVEFIDSGYLVTEPDGCQVPLDCFYHSDSSYPLFEIEVIGNIYTSPELLEATL
jgi:uncharacterized phage protein (TIGR01671 family)